MFKSLRYRAEFDAMIAQVLDEAGLRSTEAKLSFWPAGKSRQLITGGKARGIDAEDAALKGIEDFTRGSALIRDDLRKAALRAVDSIKTRRSFGFS
jgi:hypothetical protein